MISRVPCDAMRLRWLASLSILLIVLSGCVGAAPGDTAGQDATGPANLPDAPEPEANETTGSLTGVVTGDEGLPIPNVAVVVVETLAETRTDKAGRYTFNGLDATEYRLVFERVGYEEVTRKAEVRAGEVTELDVVLPALEIQIEPYHTSFSKKAYLHFGQYQTQLLLNHVNNSNMNEATCDPCRFDLDPPANVTSAMTEAMYERAVDAPSVNHKFGIVFWRDGGLAPYGTTIVLEHFHPPRTSYHWVDAEVTSLNDAEWVSMRVHGPNDGLMLSQQVEIWQTWGFFGPLPDGYTALPPE